MCGIIAVARRRTRRQPPAPGVVLALVEPVAAVLDGAAGADAGSLAAPLREAATALGRADALLRGSAGVRTLVGEPALAAALDRLLTAVHDQVERIEQRLDQNGGAGLTPGGEEDLNAALVSLEDAAWAVQRDRLPTARAVADLAGRDASPSALEAFTSVQLALSGLDRLEVRGRDSAGLHVLVRGHGLDLGSTALAALVEARSADPLFRSGSVRVADGALAFVYKAAAEIGELGDNTRVLRAALTGDELLHAAVAAETAEVTVLAHTRWASVGIVSQPNAHPLDAWEVDRAGGPYVAAVLNGDVDNFADLKAAEGLRIPPEITTDAKVIPTLVARRAEAGDELDEAFRRTCAVLDGSVAIAASAAGAPGDVLLALRGSGQALYVGLAEDLYLVASEPYGVVEECGSYLRLDGETPSDVANPAGSRGQVVHLRGDQAGTVSGIRRLSYDGTELPVAGDELVPAEITTRDIDRGDFPHFLLKEITESPSSFRKTLRGRIVDDGGRLRVRLGTDTLPGAVRDDLRSGRIRTIVVIGQGTAAVAGSACAHALSEAVAATPLRVEARLATELSGFGLRSDMADTLVIAVSQSGTTTDTNRTVDLVRSRGARVVAIVNRRRSDLVDRCDGVLYTSDGRDVEMSVASTKAFYAQVAAGFLLAFAIAELLVDDDAAALARGELLGALRELPQAMAAVIERRPVIAEAAVELCPPRRHWAVVGSGVDRIAAEELRIKLSELCYKAIACDATEDKKHIDLSSEPLIVVCATGLTGSTVDDVAKEVAIYRAHKAAPVVIATEGEDRFDAALRVIPVPAVNPALGFVLCTVAGHLFGYEAALAIDALAVPLRFARSAVEERVGSGAPVDDHLLTGLQHQLRSPGSRFFDGLRAGTYDGVLEASTAARLASVLRYAIGTVPLDLYEVEHGRLASPGVIVEDLTAALTSAIDELTRPVDAIKHQAKTVTVGISRSDEGLLQVPLVREALDAGAPRDRLAYRSLRTLAGLDPAVESVIGYTRYRIEGEPATPGVTIHVVDRGGIARDLPLRTERNPMLRGTKHRVATEREVTVAVGRSDGRSVIIVPEVKGNRCTGLTLLHGRFADRLPPSTARSVLEQYRGRYAALKDAVTETEPTFRDDLLGEVPLIDLLTQPVYVLAERWRA
ncbi:MAG: SIS domain-containing protein [Actinobacteria bacterium]|nr:SIS domain-containing protein [Actinomycetota bacterium]